MNTLNWVALILILFCSACKDSTPLAPLQKSVRLPRPETVAFRITGYKPKSNRTFSNLFVSNFSIKVSQGELLPSGGRDGLSDDLKLAHARDYGFSADNSNSANPFFSDLMLYLAGITYSQQSVLYCPENFRTSTSNDAFIYKDYRKSPAIAQFLGLRDCEKIYMGLDPKLFSNDGTGIPDYLKLRCGLNPLNTSDASLNMAGDGISNLEKCRKNIPIDESANSEANKLFAYSYMTELQADRSYQFTIKNIPLLPNGSDNFIAFYLVEKDELNQTLYLYSAYSILAGRVTNQTLEFPFWGTEPSKALNQEVSFQ